MYFTYIVTNKHNGVLYMISRRESDLLKIGHPEQAELVSAPSKDL
jgi:hypothetical protein